MTHALTLHPQIAFTLGVAAMALMVIFLRLRATKKPVTAKEIIMPPLGMSTGFLMFLNPSTHIPVAWGILAFLAGTVFLSPPLIQTSRFEVVNGQIYLKRSRAFILILLALLAVRLILHGYVERHISIPQTAGLFFILAFGMILPWRVAMFIRFRRIRGRLSDRGTATGQG